MAEGSIPKRSKRVPTPEFKEDENKCSVDITEICSNVKYKFQFLAMDRIGDVREISNWKETADLTDVWLDNNDQIRKHAYYAEKKRSNSAIRKFVTNALAIKTYEQRAAEKAAIEEIRKKYAERPIEIYNLSAVLTYLGAAPGVTISPGKLVQFLNVKKIKKAGKEYKSGRKTSCYNPLESSSKQLKENTKRFEKSIKGREQFISMHSCVTYDSREPTKSKLRSLNANRKVFAFHFARRAHGIRTKHYNEFGCSFWDYDIKSKEAFDFVFEFLMKYRPNLCKLNPEPSGKKPTLFDFLNI